MNDSFSGLWRDGKHLVVAVSSAKFPNRCIKSMEPVTSGLTSVDVLYESGGVAKQKYTFRLPLSDSWKRKGKSKVGGYTLLGSLALFFGCGVGAAFGPELFLIGLFIGVLGLIVSPFLMFFLANPIIKVHAMDSEFVWLKGVNSDFLSDLPEWSPQVGRAYLENPVHQPAVSEETSTTSDVEAHDHQKKPLQPSWAAKALAAGVCLVLTVFTFVSLSGLESGRVDTVTVWAPVALLYEAVGFGGAVGLPAFLFLLFTVLAIVAIARRD